MWADVERRQKDFHHLHTKISAYVQVFKTWGRARPAKNRRLTPFLFFFFFFSVVSGRHKHFGKQGTIGSSTEAGDNVEVFTFFFFF